MAKRKETIAAALTDSPNIEIETLDSKSDADEPKSDGEDSQITEFEPNIQFVGKSRELYQGKFVSDEPLKSFFTPTGKIILPDPDKQRENDGKFYHKDAAAIITHFSWLYKAPIHKGNI